MKHTVPPFFLPLKSRCHIGSVFQFVKVLGTNSTVNTDVLGTVFTMFLPVVAKTAVIIHSVF